MINGTLLSKGFTPRNTLFATSLFLFKQHPVLTVPAGVCVDEINHEEDDITCLLKSFWGECFYLGGLGGVPFVGRTGFGAYAHHGTSMQCCLLFVLFICLTCNVTIRTAHLGHGFLFSNISYYSVCD